MAIKLESIKSKHPQLLYESKLYKILGGGVGIPSVRSFTVEGDYNVMVMDLLGPSLEDLFNFCDRWAFARRPPARARGTGSGAGLLRRRRSGRKHPPPQRRRWLPCKPSGKERCGLPRLAEPGAPGRVRVAGLPRGAREWDTVFTRRRRTGVIPYLPLFLALFLPLSLFHPSPQHCPYPVPTHVRNHEPSHEPTPVSTVFLPRSLCLPLSLRVWTRRGARGGD